MIATLFALNASLAQWLFIIAVVFALFTIVLFVVNKPKVVEFVILLTGFTLLFMAAGLIFVA